MAPRKAPISLGPGMTPREAAMDAIYRLVGALDSNDEDLMRSAFQPDGIFDISGLSPATGMDHPEQKGIDTIVKGVLAHVGPMGSGHHVSNVRVKLNHRMDQAEIMCYVIAQHKRSDEALDASKRDYLLYGNQYWADVVSAEDGLWRIRRFEASVMWAEGVMAAVRD